MATKFGRDPENVLRPEELAILHQSIAPNGLYYAEVRCSCGAHICDQAILIGTVRKKCPRCKRPVVREINRVGEEQHPLHVQKGGLEG